MRRAAGGRLPAGVAVLFALLLATAAVAAPAKSAPIEGVIARVIDGDSLVLQPQDRAPIEVRLRDMDAPEICQDYGPAAKQALERLALGKTATLTVHARDQHGRSVGHVTVEGQSLSKLMVAEGHAWSTRTRYDRGPLMKEERMAIALRRGIHATTGAVQPKDFRKTHGPCR
ncbi:MAG: thermonuclease family protein [Rubrivivax sp.]|nr:thermonuclease family protein [Rubrivivax sp.]